MEQLAHRINVAIASTKKRPVVTHAISDVILEIENNNETIQNMRTNGKINIPTPSAARERFLVVLEELYSSYSMEHLVVL